MLTAALPRPTARADGTLPPATEVAGRLALYLWLTSMLCWWVVGIHFSRLWWLVNEKQLSWILFCLTTRAARTESGADGRPRVLVVDDERPIRLALGRYAALGILDATPVDGYDLVITDLRMPVLSGFELHDWMADHRPDLFSRLVIATGDVASQPVRQFLNRTPRPVLEKPFELSALAELVGKVRGRRA